MKSELHSKTVPTYKILHILELLELCSWLEIPHFSHTVTLSGVGMGLALHSLLLIIYLAEICFLIKAAQKNIFSPYQ